ncbi:MAG: 50S ribosomal protein L4 [Peptococcaceae bacterium]|nr:50S ribosomal protein L4 [Peptococcaceae bacterium]
MPKLEVLNMQGTPVGNIDLSDRIFGITPNIPVMHQTVTAQRANLRQGTSSTKTRSQVRGGGRKPWRQKGTGRARAGTIRSPLWRSGGIVFGPHPRDYSQKLPRKVRRLALCSALSSKVEAQKMIVIDDIALPQIKTKEMIGFLDNLNVTAKVLIILEGANPNVQLSARNIQGVKTARADALNTLDILDSDTLIFSKTAVSRLEEVLS